MPMFGIIRVVIALLLLAAPALAQNVTIHGSVAYRERIALPDNSRLSVSLVALPTGQSLANASSQIPARGQPPLAFSLNIHRPITSGTYGLVAEISIGGQVRFRNAQPVPVDPSTGIPVEILVQSVPSNPMPPLPELPADLVDALWTVTSVGGTPVSSERPITLTIASDMRASGHAGCNNYFAETSIEGSSIAFGPAAATRMACAPDLMAQESAYLSTLGAITSFELDNMQLRLLDAAGVPLVGLVREQ